jgi:ribosome recycling factor
MEKDFKAKTKDKMQHAIDSLKKELASVRTGRASLALLDGIVVMSYGVASPLNQVASLSTPDARSIVIQPWDPKTIGEIEKAIQKSDLGLTPMNDGKLVRIGIPPLTEERRRDLVKVVKKRAEETKVAVRNIRRDSNEGLKKMEKEKDISEDTLKHSLDEVQHLTDDFIKKVDEVLAHKEKEIMEV